MADTHSDVSTLVCSLPNNQCSVTCGEGQQTREVFCVASSGERLAEHACRSLLRPSSVNVCHRPACQFHITWHISDFGLVCNKMLTFLQTGWALYPINHVPVPNGPTVRSLVLLLAAF